MSTQLESSEAAILSRVIQPDSGDWPQAAAEAILRIRSEEHTSELQSRSDLVCRLLLEKKKKKKTRGIIKELIKHARHTRTDTCRPLYHTNVIERIPAGLSHRTNHIRCSSELRTPRCV